MKKIAILILTVLLMCGCGNKALPLPEVSEGMRGELGIDKNIVLAVDGQKQQLLAAYDKYKADPQHGGVFQMLIAQEQSQCRILLQLLGKLAK